MSEIIVNDEHIGDNVLNIRGTNGVIGSGSTEGEVIAEEISREEAEETAKEMNGETETSEEVEESVEEETTTTTEETKEEVEEEKPKTIDELIEEAKFLTTPTKFEEELDFLNSEEEDCLIRINRLDTVIDRMIRTKIMINKKYNEIKELKKKIVAVLSGDTDADSSYKYKLEELKLRIRLMKEEK